MSIHAHLLHKANIPLVSTKHMNEYKLPCSFFFFSRSLWHLAESGTLDEQQIQRPPKTPFIFNPRAGKLAEKPKPTQPRPLGVAIFGRFPPPGPSPEAPLPVIANPPLWGGAFRAS